MAKTQRHTGILLHPTSLPSGEGIGTFGDEAYRFADLLASAHIDRWQTLPLGPTGYGDSPYAARSTFAGNELMISMRTLATDGWLDIDDVLNVPAFNAKRVDYGAVRAWKEPLLTKAADRYLDAEGKSAEFGKFCRENASWLDDWALYMALSHAYGDSRWFRAWPKALKMREEKAMDEAKTKYAKAIAEQKAIQFFFWSQWYELKAYCNEKSIKIIGDVPMYVADESVDVWSHKELFELDASGNRTTSSGVPPDYFSTDGQLWGNPTYRWENHEKTGFAWWTARMKAALTASDIVRIDHFRGFSACWVVPARARTARHGKWVPSPGKEMIAAFRKALGQHLDIIAEDLGVITPEVEELRDSSGFPGMKILQFAFGWGKNGTLDASNAYLPHNCIPNSVVYTGTHDNNTTRGWYNDLEEGMKDKVRRYLECPDREVTWQMIRAALMSSSGTAVFPMQDWLDLDGSARMNVPSTCGSSNWSWRLESLDVPKWRIDRMRDMIDLYGRWQG